MKTFAITIRSREPLDLDGLDADGFAKLIAANIHEPHTWEQDDEGFVTVAFSHEATDHERAVGASERVANELGIGTWAVTV